MNQSTLPSPRSSFSIVTFILPSYPGQPLMEWTPVLLSSQCDIQDQLTQWLLICINISCFCSRNSPSLHAVNHIVEGNQLCLNLKDVLLFAVDYSTLGLSVEEEHFQSVSYPV